MKLDEPARDGKDVKEVGKEIPKDFGKEKGAVKISKDANSKDAKASTPVERPASSNVLTNGVDRVKEDNQPKEKVKSKDTGGMISPESLEAT